MPSQVVELARKLIARPSVTPDDAGCQDLMIARLEDLGFRVTRLPFGDVSNFWAEHGEGGPLLVLAGHTDVVPPGPREAWDSDPFEPMLRDGVLYGRGAADMKGSLAAMLVAAERFVTAHPRHRGRLAFLITSDEEGAAVDGTRKVVDWLVARGEHMDYCVVGEPSSELRLGDVIKNGRRGSLNGRLTVHGVQGHIAYPEKADNPIHRAFRPLAALAEREWDRGNAFFPPTRLQFSNIHAGTGANNVIPGALMAEFNFRFSTATTAEDLQAKVEEMLRESGISWSLEWSLSGQPFMTEPGPLLEAARQSIHRHAGIMPRLSTGGGTSDGRFIAPAGAQVVEIGPVNASIHKVNEHVRVEELELLVDIHRGIMAALLAA